MEIKFNPQSEEQLKIIQDQIDELVAVCEDQKRQLNLNVKTIDEAKTHITTLEDTARNLTSTLKTLHAVLGSKKDLFAGDEEMNEVLNALATFVLSSGAIKMGVK